MKDRPVAADRETDRHDGGPTVPRTDDRQTDMKLTDSFRKSVNALKDKNLSKQDSRIKNKSSGHPNVDDNK